MSRLVPVLLFAAGCAFAFLSACFALLGDWGPSVAYGLAAAILAGCSARGLLPRPGDPSWSRGERAFLAGKAPMPGRGGKTARRERGRR